MVGNNTLYFGVAPGTQTVDLDTWKPRVATRKENYDSVTALDALPTVHFFSPYTPYFGFEDVPPCMAMLERLFSNRHRGFPFSSVSEFSIPQPQLKGSETSILVFLTPISCLFLSVLGIVLPYLAT